MMKLTRKMGKMDMLVESNSGKSSFLSPALTK